MLNRKANAIDKENVAAIWQIVMLILCVYVLGALFVDTVTTLPTETSALLTYIDNLICLLPANSQRNAGYSLAGEVLFFGAC